MINTKNASKNRMRHTLQNENARICFMQFVPLMNNVKVANNVRVEN